MGQERAGATSHQESFEFKFFSFFPQVILLFALVFYFYTKINFINRKHVQRKLGKFFFHRFSSALRRM
jgi:hypothetical protein